MSAVKHVRWTFVASSLAIFLVASLSRLFFVVFAPFVAGDSYQYEGIARNLLDGHGYAIYVGSPTVFRAPVYPLFIAAVYGVVGPDPAAVLITQSFVGGAAAWCVYLLGRRTLPPRIALFGALLGGVYPQLAFYAGTILSETLAFFWLALSMLLLHMAATLASSRRRLFAAVACGAVFGLLALTSPYLALIPLVAVGFTLVMLPPRRVAVLALLVAIGYVGALAPWIARNDLTFGRFIPLTVGSQGFALWLAAERVGLYSYSSFGPLAASEPLMAEWVNLYRDQPQREPALLDRRIALDAAFTRDALAKILRDPVGFLKHRAQVVPFLWIQPAAYAGNFRAPFEAQNPAITKMITNQQWGPAGLRMASIALFTIMFFGGLLIGTWLLRFRFRYVAQLYAPAAYVVVFISFLWIEQRYSVATHPLLWLVSAVGIAHVARRFTGMRPDARVDAAHTGAVAS